jgi:hypothetical protein
LHGATTRERKKNLRKQNDAGSVYDRLHHNNNNNFLKFHTGDPNWDKPTKQVMYQNPVC